MATNSRRRAVLTMVLSGAVPCLAAIGVGWLLVAPAETVLLAQAPAQTPAAPPDAAAGGTPAATLDLDAIQSEGPFACRKAKYRQAVGEKFGATKESTKGVAAALYWLAKHEMAQGNWSLERYTQMCKDKSCTGVASQESLSAATALGLLPFLAAGQTQATNGPFQRTIQGGVYWLVSHQKADGDLSADAASQMYSHGLATIALCEDYGMTHDKTVGVAAQKAVNFIEAAQNGKTGGWRYHPGEEGDTSVFGWQLAALKTAEMAGLTVKPATFDGAKKWLQSCAAAGADTGKFSYQPEGGATPTMSAVGTLASQYLHAGPNDPVILGGLQFLTLNPPDIDKHNIYYWYYGTQAMHNMGDKFGGAWNQKARQILVDTQAREACAAGSWDPAIPNKDAWGLYGGRLMQTSLSCLTLEVSNRYLPVYLKRDGSAPAQTPPKAQDSSNDSIGEPTPSADPQGRSATLKPKVAERAVAAALYWLAKHQSTDGKWSLEKYTEQCKDKTCTGVGSVESLPAATALGLLPFLAAGQSQATAGPFQTTITNGTEWLASHQKADGDLSAGEASQMYAHGLAAIALCEDFGMSHDKRIGEAAQKAINFIEAAQNSKTGGWRYHPGEEGDTSVFGWQMSALKSAQLAGLSVKPATWDGAKKWLNSCADAKNAGRFSYQPEGGPTPPMSAIGVLANQYLKAGRTDPVVTGGVQLLMANQPNPRNRNVYYWFYGTEAMHNMADKDWDAWHQKINKVLTDSQDHEGCASGSWDPAKPTKDAWGPTGGRLMQTSLSCLAMEVYYRYLKLYQLDKVQKPSDDGAKK